MKIKNKIIIILGPTASGKTDLGIFLAKKYGGEIVSADSRLVYKGLDIGTAKPLKDNPNNKEYIVSGIPHYLIDCCSPKNPFNVAVFKNKAIWRLREIIKRKKLPFLVGGTGLYLDAISKNLSFPGIIADQSLRDALEMKDMPDLIKEYQSLDPLGAKNIDINNKRRLIRAIEVCRLTGKPFWESRKTEEPIFDCLKIGIPTEKEILLERIKQRVDKMISSGLQREAFKLIKRHGLIPPLQTIGYQEWANYINKNLSEKDISEIKEAITNNTFKFAKRQMTWFKRDKDIHWTDNKNQITKLINNFINK